MPEPRTPLYCDCHGTQVVGYLVNGKAVWFVESHSVKHFKSIQLDNLHATMPPSQSDG